MEKNFQTGSHTDVGLVRQVNEDFLGYFDTPNGDVFIVCDGLGGHVGGATASRLAVESIRNFFQHQVYSNHTEALKNALFFANEQIAKYAMQDPELEGMGTTCVVVLLKDDQAFYAHVGDTRLYLSKNGILKQITNDHSFAQQQFEQGTLTREEIELHPNRNEVLRALGFESQLNVEVGEIPLWLENDDTLLICTDGLHHFVKDEMIQMVLNSNWTPQEKANQLVQMANNAGGTDNISVQVVQYAKPQAKQNFFENALLAEEILITEKPIDPARPENVVQNQPVENSIKNTPKTPDPIKENTSTSNFPKAEKSNLKKSIDWALIVLLILFTIVLVLFFSGWGYMTDDQNTNELTTTSPVDSLAIKEEINQTVSQDPIPNTSDNQTKAKEEKVEEKKPEKKEKTEKTDDSEKHVSKKDTIISYIVKSGENLSKISERFNLKKSTVKKLNKMDDDELKADQKLKIKVKAVHLVGPGDVLSVVAEKYNVSREAIKKANEMTENKTKRGEKLIIPLAKPQ